MKRFKAVLLSFVMMLSLVTPVFANFEYEIVSRTIFENVKIQEIELLELTDYETIEEIYNTANRHNIDLSRAFITLHDNGVITFFEPFAFIPFDEPTEEFYEGLIKVDDFARTQNRLTTAIAKILKYLILT